MQLTKWAIRVIVKPMPVVNDFIVTGEFDSYDEANNWALENLNNMEVVTGWQVLEVFATEAWEYDMRQREMLK